MKRSNVVDYFGLIGIRGQMNELMKCFRLSSLSRSYGMLILALSPWLLVEVARFCVRMRSGASKMSKIPQVGPSGTIAFQDRKRSIGNDVLVKNVPIKNVFGRFKVELFKKE